MNLGREELGKIWDKNSDELLKLGGLWDIGWILVWGLDLTRGLIGCEPDWGDWTIKDMWWEELGTCVDYDTRYMRKI